MKREQRMRHVEWTFAENERSPDDYDIPGRPVAPDVGEDHPEHLSAEETWDVIP